MEKEISYRKMIKKIIALIISIILLITIVSLNILKIYIIDIKYLFITISISLILSLGSVIFKYLNLNKKTKYFYYQIIDFFLMLNAALLVVHIFFIVAFFPATVYKSSMYPTLEERDHLLVRRLEKPERFDIVVLKVDENINTLTYGVENDELIVKRIIGVSGDYLYYNNLGILVLNGNEVTETYLLDENGQFKTDDVIYNTKTNPFRLEDIGKINGENICKPNEECTIPEGYYFVLGDNRTMSVDSRHIGLFHYSQIIGVAKYKQISLIKWEKIS